jgi:hypothetical protein
MKTCFSIMPFMAGFGDIDQIIAEAAAECGFEYVRGDRRLKPGSVLQQLLGEIEQASVVVADITGNNPNVFYELGVAHHVKGADRVVILTQTLDAVPYDVHEFRQLAYSHTVEGRAQLRAKLPAVLRAAAAADVTREVWKVIRGCGPRTRMLVRDLQRLADATPSQSLGDLTIRVAAGMSSIAISDHEPDARLDTAYAQSLLAERNALRSVLLRGARLKAVLNPPRRFAQSMIPERLRVRYERLIGLLEGRSDIEDPDTAALDLAQLRQCTFVLSPVPMPNLFIIGDQVVYEGVKRAGRGGFDMTHCETNTDAVLTLIDQFDRFFEDSHAEMVRRHPPDGRLAEQLRAYYAEAVAIEEERT